MKIGYVINEKYKEIQVLICADSMNLQVKEVADSITEALRETIVVYTQNGAEKISQDSIIRVYSQGHNVMAQTSSDIYRLHMRLYEAQEMLGNSFIRISNSEIVNIHKIKRLDTTLAGTIKIYLANDIDSYVSRRYVGKIKKALEI